MSDGKIRPPWDPATVEALNRWQANSWVHPFTCECGAVLEATSAGWVCLACDYRQDWAWAVMTTEGPPGLF